jgi:hypothetical protein
MRTYQLLQAQKGGVGGFFIANSEGCAASTKPKAAA